MNLDTSVRYVKGVGEKRAELFAKLGVHTVRDLLEYYPFKWEFFQKPIKMAELKKGLENE